MITCKLDLDTLLGVYQGRGSVSLCATGLAKYWHLDPIETPHIWLRVSRAPFKGATQLRLHELVHYNGITYSWSRFVRWGGHITVISGPTLDYVVAKLQLWPARKEGARLYFSITTKEPKGSYGKGRKRK